MTTEVYSLSFVQQNSRRRSGGVMQNEDTSLDIGRWRMVMRAGTMCIVGYAYGRCSLTQMLREGCYIIRHAVGAPATQRPR